MPISPRLWLELEKLTDRDLEVVKKYVDDRLKDHTGNKGTVVERRPFDDGWLQLEYRVYKPTGRRSGPYWSFYRIEDGKQKREYVGRNLDAWIAKRSHD